MRFAQLYSLSSVVRVEPSDNKWLNLSLVRNLGGIPGGVEGVWPRVDGDWAVLLREGRSSAFIFVVRSLNFFSLIKNASRLFPASLPGLARVLSRTANALLRNRKEKELNCYRFYQILSPR